MRLHFPPPNRQIGVVDALGLLGVAALLVGRFIPVARLIPFWGCAFRQLTGWPCPGCGLTRAVDHTAHLRLVAALQANPLGTLALLTLAALAVYAALHLALQVPVPEVTLRPREWTALRVAAVVLVAANYAFVIVQHRTHWWT